MAAVAIPLGHKEDIPVRFDGRVHRILGKAKALARHEARRLLVPLAMLTAISSLATVASPGLAGRPLLLVALSPRLAFLTLAAPKVGLLPFLAVGMFRLCLADPFHFVLGRRHGTAALDKLPGKRWLDRVRRLAGHSVPLLVFLRPSGTNLAIAGASRSRVVQVVAADLVGTFVYLLLVHQVGHSMLPT